MAENDMSVKPEVEEIEMDCGYKSKSLTRAGKSLNCVLSSNGDVPLSRDNWVSLDWTEVSNRWAQTTGGIDTAK